MDHLSIFILFFIIATLATRRGDERLPGLPMPEQGDRVEASRACRAISCVSLVSARAFARACPYELQATWSCRDAFLTSSSKRDTWPGLQAVRETFTDATTAIITATAADDDDQPMPPPPTTIHLLQPAFVKVKPNRQFGLRSEAGRTRSSPTTTTRPSPTQGLDRTPVGL